MIVYRTIDQITDENTMVTDMLKILVSRSWRIVSRKVPFVDQSLQAWIRRQEAYLKQLPWEDQAVVLAYTYEGHHMINGFLRRRLTRKDLFGPRFLQRYHEYIHPIAIILLIQNPRATYGNILRSLWARRMTLTPRWIRKILICYIRRLAQIIRKAPHAPSDLVVYRGIDNAAFLLHNDESDEEKMLRNQSFFSTTLSVTQALKFIHHDRCCLQRIRVPAGTKCVFLPFLSYYPQEMEILFPPGTGIRDLENTHWLRKKIKTFDYLLHQRIG